ncbi:MAG TPA: hypothetical protein P5511_02920 [Candidatus Goldiibacteriota bacterium]|nr:hypothetical protein [Candidatus Goldiibacteriota bacterium]
MRPKAVETIMKALFVLFFLSAVFAASAGRFVTSETFGHAANGRELMAKAGFPGSMEFSYAGSTAWDYTGWLFDVFAHSSIFLLGASAWLIRPALLLFVFFGLYLVVYKRQQGKYITVTLLLSLFGAYLLERGFEFGPGAFALIFTAYFMYVLERKPRKRNKALYLSLPAMALLWSNMHYTAVAAVVLCLVYIIYRLVERSEEEAKKEEYDMRLLFTASLATAVAVLLNPGLYAGAAEAAKELFSSPWLEGYSFGRRGIREIFPFLVYACLVATLLAYNIVKGADVGRRAELIKDSLLLAVFAAAAARNAVFKPFFLVVSIPVAAYYSYLIFRWDFVWPKQWAEADLTRIKNRLYAIMIPVLAFCTASYAVKERPAAPYPAGAAAYISGTQVPVNIFSEARWAGYMKYMLYPEYKVLYDPSSRNPASAAEDYGIIYNGDRGWKEALEKNSVSTAVLDLKAPSLVKFNEAGFKTAYFDDNYAVLVDAKKTGRYFKNVSPLEENFFDAANTLNALSELEQFSEEFPSERALLLTAKIYAASGKSRAIDYLSYMIDRYPVYYGLYNLKAGLLYEAGDYENAYETLKNSKKRGPEEEAALKDLRIRLKAR